MVYKTFLETIKQSVKEELGTEFTLSIHSITKNNGLILDGLCIGKTGKHIASTIYLNQFYEFYQKGVPINEIIHNIIQIYEENTIPEDISMDYLTSPEYVKGRIFYRLMNRSANSSLLLNVPHISYEELDLCLVFYLSLHETNQNLMTSLIYNSHLESWNLSYEELVQIATMNTPRFFPSKIYPLSEVIKKIALTDFKNHEEEDDILHEESLSPPIFVLTNHIGINGAACLFYDGILKDFARSKDSDLIILPSSIHEVLMIPKTEDISVDKLAEIVFSINQEEVSKEDRLSNHIYLYSRGTDKLSLAFASSFSIAASTDQKFPESFF